MHLRGHWQRTDSLAACVGPGHEPSSLLRSKHTRLTRSPTACTSTLAEPSTCVFAGKEAHQPITTAPHGPQPMQVMATKPRTVAALEYRTVTPTATPPPTAPPNPTPPLDCEQSQTWRASALVPRDKHDPPRHARTHGAPTHNPAQHRQCPHCARRPTHPPTPSTHKRAHTTNTESTCASAPHRGCKQEGLVHDN